MQFLRGSLIGLLAVVAAIALGPWSSGSAFHQAVHDLFQDPADLTFQGPEAQDALASSIATGDFNGDGIQDLLMGTVFDDHGPANDRYAAGAAYVIFGPLSAAGDVDLLSASPNLTIFGADPGDGLGQAVAGGDFDGDGTDDILVVAHSADGPGTGECYNPWGPWTGYGDRCEGGEAYVIYGSATLGGTIDLADPLDAGDFATIYGAETGDVLGWSADVGDFDNNGRDDLLIGAYLGDSLANGRVNAGEVYVIRGDDLPPAGGSIDLADPADAGRFSAILGAESGDITGSSVGVGDFDGDLLDDILVGAGFADAVGNAKSRAGEVYVIRGAALRPAGSNIDLFADTELFVRIVGADAGDRLGATFWSPMAAGRFDGDGKDDLILAANRAGGPNDDEPLSGEVYVILGDSLTAAGSTIDLDTTGLIDLVVYGADAGDRLGLTMAVEDITGDGVDDLVLGTRFADAENNLKDDAGEVYVIFGRTTGTLDLGNVAADLTVYGSDAGDWAGRSVLADDLNDDGAIDLVITAQGSDGPGSGTSCGTDQEGDRCFGGEVYVFFGFVPTPQENVQNVMAEIDELIDAGVIIPGDGTPLNTKLANTINSLDRGNLGAATNQLDAFINQVEGLFIAGQLSLAERNALVDAVTAILISLGG